MQYHLWTEKLAVRKHSLFRSLVERYHNLNIYKLFGINFLDFMNLPMDRVDELFEMSVILAENDERRRSEAQKEMEQKMNQPGANVAEQLRGIGM